LYLLCFYVPEADAEAVKAAVFAAGAGRIGQYDQCCWQVSGQGQFRPLAGSNPAIGQPGTLATVPEVKVEMVCAATCIGAAVAALLAAHPYEEPAWHVLQCVREFPDT
jgi:hypothetical protein